MASQLRLFTLVLSLVMAVMASGARSEPPDQEIIWDLISKGKCLEALRKIRPSADFHELLSSPTGKCFYAKSICCSPVSEISNKDIDEAIIHLNEAKSSIENLTSSGLMWIDDARKQCEETRLSKANDEIVSKDEQIDKNIGSIKIVSHYHGKIMAGCESPNLSPVLIPFRDSATNQFWRYPVLSSEGSVVPPGDFLAMLKDAYVGAPPGVEICPPFIALSDSQDPKKICKAAHRFVDYFDKNYEIVRLSGYRSIITPRPISRIAMPVRQRVISIATRSWAIMTGIANLLSSGPRPAISELFDMSSAMLCFSGICRWRRDGLRKAYPRFMKTPIHATGVSKTTGGSESWIRQV